MPTRGMNTRIVVAQVHHKLQHVTKTCFVLVLRFTSSIVAHLSPVPADDMPICSMHTGVASPDRHDKATAVEHASEEQSDPCVDPEVCRPCSFFVRTVHGKVK